MRASTRAYCLVIAAGCVMLLLLQHQLLSASHPPALAGAGGAAAAAPYADGGAPWIGDAPFARAGFAGGLEGASGPALVRTADGAAGASPPSAAAAAAAAGGAAGGADADGGGAAEALARAALAGALRAASSEVSAEPHPDAALGGDLYDEPVLLREADAVALRRADGRREIILIPTSYSYGHYTLNLLLNLKRLGYWHALLLGADRDACANATGYSPVPSRCVWDGRWWRDKPFIQRAEPFASFCTRARDCLTNPSEPQASYRLWLSRWVANARLVAAGYNTLMLDVDFGLADDPYEFLHAPPFNRFNLMFHSEAFGDAKGNVQCGFVYVQGARKGGGAATAVAGYADRIFRFLDTRAEEAAEAAAIGEAAAAAAAANGSAASSRLMSRVAREAYFVFDQVHMVDVVQSQINGRSTFKSARSYFADVSRETFERPPAPTPTPTPTAGGNGTAAAPPPKDSRLPINQWRVVKLYEEYLAALGRSDSWQRLDISAAVPDSWRLRFGLEPRHEAVWADGLTDGIPVDTRDLPLEFGSHPLRPVRPGSLAAEYRALLERDAAASYLHRLAPARHPGGAAQQQPAPGAAGAGVDAGAPAPAPTPPHEQLPEPVARWVAAMLGEEGEGPRAAARALGKLRVRSLADLAAVSPADAAARCEAAAAARAAPAAATAAAPGGDGCAALAVSLRVLARLSAQQLQSPAGAASLLDSGGGAAAWASGPPTGAQEMVALIPTWLVSHWREGVRGLWGMDPPAVMGVHATGATDKLLTLIANGLFDRQAYRAAPRSVHAAAFVRAERPPLVAYLPALSFPTRAAADGQQPDGAAAAAAALHRAALDFDEADSFRAAAVQGLPAAAILAGRHFGFPHVPCESGWLNRLPDPVPTRAPGGRLPGVLRAPARAAQGAAAPGDGAAHRTPWRFEKCRTGLCREWRVVPVGYVSAEEARARAELRGPSRAPRAAGTLAPATATAAASSDHAVGRGLANRPAPDQALSCTLHPNMIWPDGPVRWAWGNRCNGHTTYRGAGGHKLAGVGHAFSPFDVRAYAERLGADAAPALGVNVAFGERVADFLPPEAMAGGRGGGGAAASAPRPPALLNVTTAELRAELARFASVPLLWLGWPINVTDPAEGPGRLAARMRALCLSDEPQTNRTVPL